MNTRRVTMLVSSIVAMFGSSVFSTVTVTQIGGSGTFTSSVTPAPGNAVDVSIDAVGNQDIALLILGDAGDIIRNVSVTSGDHPGLGVSSVVLDILGVPSTAGISRLENVIQIGGTGELWIRSIDVNGNIGVAGSSQGGSIRANLIESVFARGTGSNITANIIADQSVRFRPDIGLVQAGGSVYGGVSAPNSLTGSSPEQSGNVGRVIAVGNIGSNSQTGSIFARGSIVEVSAASIFANIQTNTTFTGSIQRIATTGGDFTGEITTRSIELLDAALPVGLSISGAMKGNIIMTDGLVPPAGDFTMTTLDAGKRIQIASSLASSRSITISQSQGLKGQVIINAANLAAAWDGTVTVGGVTLSPKPSYSQTNLGGGAVGRVPYRLYVNDSSPVSGATVNGVNVALIRHYGPVERVGTGLPVVVKRRPLAGQDFFDVSDLFEIDGGAPSGRTLGIRTIGGGSFPSGFEYRIEHTGGAANSLVCAELFGPFGTRFAAASYAYTFIIP